MIIIRLWHKDLIPHLPKNQLLGQWRECCCIAKNIADNGTPNHILVNKVLNYPFRHFYSYTGLVCDELIERGYKCDWTKFTNWFDKINCMECHYINKSEIFKDWHNIRYLKQCLYNLQEKYDCGGISKEEWNNIIRNFYFIYKLRNL